MGVLNDADTSAVQGSMANINKDVQGQIGAVYKVLFTNHKDIHKMFKNFSEVNPADIATAPDFSAFAVKFAADLTKLTASISSDADYKGWIAQSKKRHIPARGVNKAQYGAVLDTIATVTGVDAWKSLGAAVVTSMG